MASRIVKRGSIVLIRYPFTDLSGEKVRPAIILTPDSLLPILPDDTTLMHEIDQKLQIALGLSS